MSTPTCPNRETLFQYSVGMIYGVQRDALDIHLDCCPNCQTTIMSLNDADDTIIHRLRTPLSSESVLAEPQLHSALAAAMEIPIQMQTSEKGDSSLAGRLASGMPETLGEYHLIECVGQGGMGMVYKAIQTKLDRVVALKILPRSRVGDPKAISRFEREIKAIGRLAHPNIVQAYDAREIDGALVLIMEFVDGMDLGQVMQRLGRVPMAEACELIRQACSGLQYIYKQGLVHRDLKPSNLMLISQGTVKILDLGLARFHLEKAEDEMTNAGEAMGTADYMAPEQASDSRKVDIRADIYSLGCTLYKFLSGRAPFSGPEYRTSLDKLNAHIHQPAPSICRLVPNVPEKLASIIDRMLAKNPDARFAKPAEVAEALAPWCVGANPSNLLKRAVEAPRSHFPPEDGRGENNVLGGPHITKPPMARWNWKSIAAMLVALMLFGGLCFALGIMIVIWNDGKEMGSITLPKGGSVNINANGQVNFEKSDDKAGGVIEQAENIVTSSRYLGHLPQGTVELVGITDYLPTNQSKWWQPDGSAAHLDSFLPQPTRYSLSRDKKTFTFLLRLQNLPAGASYPAWFLEPKARSWVATGVLDVQGDIIPDYHMFSAELNTSEALTADFRIGVSMGEWKTLIKQQADSDGTSSFNQDGRQCTVTFHKPTSDISANTTKVTLTDNVEYGTLFTRLVAIANDGSKLASSIGYKGHNGTAVFNLPLSSIKEFEYQVRPYYWVEFTNVSLQSGHKTEVQVVPSNIEASPYKEPALKPDAGSG